MILISHRGNIMGKNSKLENAPKYIDESLNMGFDCEIDIWLLNRKIFLGHDSPVHKISMNWIISRKNKLWIHCKNSDSIRYFLDIKKSLNFFWHQNDLLTLTSKKFLWVHPGKQPISNSIAVLPELYNDDTTNCIGICSDFISNYKKI